MSIINIYFKYKSRFPSFDLKNYIVSGDEKNDL